MEWRSGLCASQTNSKLSKPFLYVPCFVHWNSVMLKQERASPPSCCHKVESHNFLEWHYML
uniref:Uncharacterized protein n=1 Tax=Anguilla anguilla TaxID=7936 RepID=A0A0E9S9Q8_ANGAN